MNQVIIRECGKENISCQYMLDLTETSIKDCIGCWSCWIRTPGKCVHSDLNDFYRAYLAADRVILFSKVSKNFVSGNLKSLFDRMLPLFLPYITYESGESMHVPRYEKYPEVEVYYEGSFASKEQENVYLDYMHRVFYQFNSKCEVVKPIAEFSLEENTL